MNTQPTIIPLVLKMVLRAILKTAMFKRQRLWWLGLLMLSVAFSTASAAASDNVPIGEVTLLIGQASAKAPNGESRGLRQGEPVYAQDIITTRGNGHVHLRFIDDARLSVRPGSRLTLHTYAFDAAAPDQSRIRFDLDSGGARAISGQGAEKARERYRFNTPLAAIGVRGTDFTVTVDAQRVRAFVNQGAIAMAPFSVNCSAESLGPCRGALELRGGSQEILEIGRNEQELRRLQLTLDDTLGLQRANGQFQPNDNANSRVERHHEPSDEAQSEEPSQESSQGETPPTDQTGADLDTRDSDTKRNDDPLPNDESTQAGSEPPWLDSSERPLSPDELLLTPGAGEHALPPPSERQLVWGHWEDAADMPDYALPFEQAADGRVTRVRTRDLILLRREPDGASLSTQHLGQVAFRLDSAAATLHQQGQRSDMSVTAGALNIDFNQQSFITALDLEHADTGALRFSMQGEVKDSGLLIGTSGNGALVGAGSLDGAEAAYYFQHLIDQGHIEGTTLWGAQ